ncbi:acyl-coenzyme A thioesterase 1 isoform X2 [Alligator mississippiensis]|nr:acyl-coenzyme A thioesterase 1 isoform X2 [Alligator mississippiensis]
MAAGGLCSAAAAARAVSRGWRGAATLAVHPAAGLADEAVETRALGLSPRQAVTLRALATAELGGSLFASCAHYEADAGGRLELARAAALGGDFRGLEPMGLFWSLAPAALEPPYRRLVPRGLRPLCVDLLLHDGHSPAGALPGPLLARARLERCFTAPGVRRVRLKEGRVRGSLFLPAGDGPFPGVIDMFGDEGGLTEYRASLLANRGFAALSLPYFDFEDLPRVMKDLNFQYFEEAVRFLQHHPKVKGPGIGVIGTGKGAELAFSMITYLPEVVAAVCISGCSFHTVTDLHYGSDSAVLTQANSHRISSRTLTK